MSRNEDCIQIIMGKRCFIATPLQGDGKWQEKLTELREIMYPVLSSLGFDVIVDSSEIKEIGNITEQIMQHVINDDLMIANLTGLNPNVMYEVAVRHSTGKPCIHICESGITLPFDIKDYRTIFYEDSLGGASRLKTSLLEMIKPLNYDERYGNPLMKDPMRFVMLAEKHTRGSEFDPGEGKSVSDDEGVFYVTKDDKSQPVDYRHRLVLIADPLTSYSYCTNKYINTDKFEELIVEVENLRAFNILFICLVKENGERFIFQHTNEQEKYIVNVDKITGNYKIEVGITAGVETAISQIKKIYTKEKPNGTKK